MRRTTSNGVRVRLTPVEPVQIDVGRMGALDLTKPLQVEITSERPRATSSSPGMWSGTIHVDAGSWTVVVNRRP